jgi:glycerol-3-phosphate acyltransferase PlsY
MRRQGVLIALLLFISLPWLLLRLTLTCIVSKYSIKYFSFIKRTIFRNKRSYCTQSFPDWAFFQLMECCFIIWRHDIRLNDTWQNDTQHNENHVYSTVEWHFAKCDKLSVILLVLLISNPWIS